MPMYRIPILDSDLTAFNGTYSSVENHWSRWSMIWREKVFQIFSLSVSFPPSLTLSGIKKKKLMLFNEREEKEMRKVRTRKGLI